MMVIKMEDHVRFTAFNNFFLKSRLIRQVQIQLYSFGFVGFCGRIGFCQGLRSMCESEKCTLHRWTDKGCFNHQAPHLLQRLHWSPAFWPCCNNGSGVWVSVELVFLYHSQSTASTPAITDHLSLKVVVNLIAAFLLHHLLLHYSIVKIYLLWFQKSLGLDWLRPQLTPPSHLHTELDLLLSISTIYLKNLI